VLLGFLWRACPHLRTTPVRVLRALAPGAGLSLLTALALTSLAGILPQVTPPLHLAAQTLVAGLILALGLRLTTPAKQTAP
jgi:hypothetical protein